MVYQTTDARLSCDIEAQCKNVIDYLFGHVYKFADKYIKSQHVVDDTPTETIKCDTPDKIKKDILNNLKNKHNDEKWKKFDHNVKLYISNVIYTWANTGYDNCFITFEELLCFHNETVGGDKLKSCEGLQYRHTSMYENRFAFHYLAYEKEYMRQAIIKIGEEVANQNELTFDVVKSNRLSEYGGIQFHW